MGPPTRVKFAARAKQGKQITISKPYKGKKYPEKLCVQLKEFDSDPLWEPLTWFEKC